MAEENDFAVYALAGGWILALIEPTPIGEAGMATITAAWAALGLVDNDG
jgi:hypothetical protein